MTAVDYHHVIDSPAFAGTADFSNASPVGLPARQTLGPFTGRFSCAATETWVTNNEQWGVNNELWNDTRGTAPSGPTHVWTDHSGILVPGGATIDRVHFKGRTNNAEVTDWDLAIFAVTAVDPADWETGINSDAELVRTEISRTTRSTWNNPTVSGSTNQWFRQTLEIGHTVDAAQPHAELIFALYPTNTGAVEHYLYSSFTIEITLP